MTTPAIEQPSRGPRWGWLTSRALWACVFLIGFCVSLGGSYYAAKAPGVYWSSVKVKFFAPVSADNPNPYNTSSSSLAVTAGLIGKMVGATTPAAPFNSETVPLAGQGIRDGQEIALSNAGGQWVAIYGNPWLDVQADGPRSEVVVARMNSMVATIHNTLSDLQKDVLKRDRITVGLDPDPLPIYYQKGNRPRAAIAAFAFGMIITVCLVTVGRRDAVRSNLNRQDSAAADAAAARFERDSAASLLAL